MRALVLLAVLLGVGGCATGTGGRSDHYLRYVAFEMPGGEHVGLHWPKRDMPIRVHLPLPPAEMASDPEAVFDSVRDGVTDWADVAGPGVPSFAFVGDSGEADIPIVWEAASNDPSWYVAHCIYDINVMQRRFGVARILVTTQWRGWEVPLDTLYTTVLHEMGHALGLGGHSPEQGDVMYESVSGGGSDLSPRDRETLRRLYARPVGKVIVGPRSAD